MEGLGTIQFKRRALPGRVSIRDVQEVVCAKYGLGLKAMIARANCRSVARPRQIAMHLSREWTGKSLPEIGRQFGNRDHTTVLFGDRMTKARMVQSPELAQTVSELREQIVAIIREREPFKPVDGISLANEVAEANALLLCAA